MSSSKRRSHAAASRLSTTLVSARASDSAQWSALPQSKSSTLSLLLAASGSSPAWYSLCMSSAQSRSALGTSPASAAAPEPERMRSATNSSNMASQCSSMTPQSKPMRSSRSRRLSLSLPRRAKICCDSAHWRISSATLALGRGSSSSAQAASVTKQRNHSSSSTELPSSSGQLTSSAPICDALAPSWHSSRSSGARLFVTVRRRRLSSSARPRLVTRHEHAATTTSRASSGAMPSASSAFSISAVALSLATLAARRLRTTCSDGRMASPQPSPSRTSWYTSSYWLRSSASSPETRRSCGAAPPSPTPAPGAPSPVAPS
mmetsp:Transcript_4144/g.16640  ORF Transcript_4144/g.16640 Transcript_4144/m.16640 type:complete len:319 (+) Transcript_4144:256-1212(+)